MHSKAKQSKEKQCKSKQYPMKRHNKKSASHFQIVKPETGPSNVLIATIATSH